jgi:hypothetical protein
MVSGSMYPRSAVGSRCGARRWCLGHAGGRRVA